MVDLSPARGREQDGMRPAMVLSVDKFNHGPADLLIVVPITKTRHNIPTHVPVPMGEEKDLPRASWAFPQFFSHGWNTA